MPTANLIEIGSPLTPATPIAQLRAQLFSSGSKAYVFVDPLLGDTLNRAALDDVRTSAHFVSLPNWGIAPEEFPYFLPIDPLLDSLLDQSFELAVAQAGYPDEAHGISGWFVSDLPAAKLKQLFAAQMRRKTPQGQAWLFRFFDPRVIRHLPYVFGPDVAIAGIERWWFIDHEGTLQSLPGTPQTERRLEPSVSQQGMIDRIGLVNQAFSQWCDSGEAIPKDALTRLDVAATCALNLGLRLGCGADCVAFMLHRCLIHPSIELHPQIARWIAQARENESTYADNAAQSDGELWMNIQAGEWMKSQQGMENG